MLGSALRGKLEGATDGCTGWRRDNPSLKALCQSGVRLVMYPLLGQLVY
jgi:hypothetical protein